MLQNKKNTLLAVFFSASALACTGMCGWGMSNEESIQIYKLCQQSGKYFSAADFAQALRCLKLAAVHDPSSYSSYIHENMSDCLQQMKNYDGAIEEAKKALVYDANSSRALYCLAQCYYNSQHFDTATFYLKKILQTSKRQMWISAAKSLLERIGTYGKANLADDEIKKGNYEKARKILEEVAKNDPSDISAYVHQDLAYILRNNGKPEQAAEEAKKSLKYNSHNANTMYTLAVCYQDLGQYADALNALRQCLLLEGDEQRRKNIQEMISELECDKVKLNPAANSAPDYFDTMVGEGGPSHWPLQKLPIKVFIRAGESVKGFRKEYPNFIIHAMDTWCAASGRKLSYKLVDRESDASIVVTWQPSAIMIEEDGRQRKKQGLATTSANSEREIDSVLVQVDTMKGFQPDIPLDPSECAAVCMHEIGHSLGLKHSTCVSDIMFFGSSAKQTGEPTSRDKCTIARIYQDYPVTAFAPKVAPIAPIKFAPPPSFMPPEPADEKLLEPPVFLPPPLQDDEDKLLPPPFFQPAPIASPDKKNADAPPSLPVFLPPPVEAASPVNKSEKNPGKDNSQAGVPAAKKTPNIKQPTQNKSPGLASSKSRKPNGAADLPFFMPPPAK